MAKVDTYGSGLNSYGVSGGTSSACGYPYVLPEVHYYQQSGTPDSCATDAGDGTPDAQQLCYSWLSLDKTGGSPYKLVTGEWYSSADGGRVVRYQLNPTSASTYPGLLNMSGGKTVIQDAYTLPGYWGLQGGMTWTDSAGLLNFAFSKGCGTKPAVFSHTWVGDTRAVTSCASGGNWAVGSPQALSYWPKLDGHPGGRAVGADGGHLRRHLAAGLVPVRVPGHLRERQRLRRLQRYGQSVAPLGLRRRFRRLGCPEPALTYGGHA